MSAISIEGDLAVRQYWACDDVSLLFFRHCMYERRNPQFPGGWVVGVLLGAEVYEFLDIEHEIPKRKAIMDDFGNLVRVQ